MLVLVTVSIPVFGRNVSYTRVKIRHRPDCRATSSSLKTQTAACDLTLWARSTATGLPSARHSLQLVVESVVRQPGLVGCTHWDKRRSGRMSSAVGTAAPLPHARSSCWGRRAHRLMWFAVVSACWSMAVCAWG